MFRWLTLSAAIFFIVTNFWEITTAAPSSVKVSVYHINGKRPVHVVSDKFLSFTIDPEIIAHVAECHLSNASVNLIRSLKPAYLRIAGPNSNKLLFQSSPESASTQILSTETAANGKSKHMFVTGSQWIKFNEFISSLGLNVIVSLNGGVFDENKNLDLSNALEFITFSNKNNFNLHWQLGFELQRIADDDGKRTGHDVVRLRKILEVFPRYQNSLILGPDMTKFDSRDDVSFIRNYLAEAQDSLNVFTLHPDFSGVKEKDNVYEILADTMSRMDYHLWSKEGILKPVSKGVVPRKPIWIAESEAKDSVCKFSECLSMVKRLGVAARLGVSVYLRKPHLLTIYEPTSEYWVSILYKALVGRTVLDIKLTNSNITKVHTFSHCTQILENPEESIINPSASAYERGAITVYGVNAGSEPSRISFRIGFKFDETAHIYVLTEESTNGYSSKTLLNKQQLGLSKENELPMVSPKVRESANYVVVPARSIFFVVFPNAKCKACTSQSADESQDAAKAKIKSPVDEEEAIDETGSFANNVLDAIEEDVEDNTQYVSYPTRNERHHELEPTGQESVEEAEFKPRTKGEKYTIQSDPRSGVKYITFSDETWLSSFPEIYKEVSGKEQSHSSGAKKEFKHSKQGKYRIIAQALLGKRNVTTGLTDSAYLQNAADAPSAGVDQFKSSTRFTRSIDDDRFRERFMDAIFVDEPEGLVETPERIYRVPYARYDDLPEEIESNAMEYIGSDPHFQEMGAALIGEKMFATANDRKNELRKRRDIDDGVVGKLISNRIPEQIVEDKTSQLTVLETANENNATETSITKFNSTLSEVLSKQEVRRKIPVEDSDDASSPLARAHREIDDEEDHLNEYPVNEASSFTDLQDRRHSANRFKPVSPFPRQKPIKSGPKKSSKQLPKRTPSEKCEDSVSSAQLIHVPAPPATDTTEASQQPALTPKVEGSNETTETKISSTVSSALTPTTDTSSPAASQNTETVGTKRLEEWSTKSVIQNPNAESASTKTSAEDTTVPSRNNPPNLNVITPHSRSAAGDGENDELISKIVSPIQDRGYNSTDERAHVQDQGSKVEHEPTRGRAKTGNDKDRVALAVPPRNRANDGKKAVRKPAVAPKSEMKTKRPNMTELLDAYAARIKEILEQRIADLKKRMSDTSAKAKKLEPKHAPLSRNKRETRDEPHAAPQTATADHSAALTSNSDNKNQTTTRDAVSDDIVSMPRQRPSSSKKSPSTPPSAALQTSTASPVSKKPYKTSGARYRPIRTHTAPPTSIFKARSTVRPQQTAPSNSEKLHRRMERSLLDDVTRKVEDELEPVAKWFEKRIDDVKTEGVSKGIEKAFTPVAKWFEERVDGVKTRGVADEARKTLSPVSKWLEERLDDVAATGVEKNRPVRELARGQFESESRRARRDLADTKARIQARKEEIRERLAELRRRARNRGASSRQKRAAIAELELDRPKRDLAAAKRRIKEREEKIREKIAEKFHRGIRPRRDVSSEARLDKHVDVPSSRHEPALPSVDVSSSTLQVRRKVNVLPSSGLEPERRPDILDLKERLRKRTEEIEEKLAANRLHDRQPRTQDATDRAADRPRSSKSADQDKAKIDNRRRQIIARLEELKNRTAHPHPSSHKKQTPKSTDHEVHVRDNEQPAHSRRERSVDDNKIFEEENEVDRKAKNDNTLGYDNFKDNLKRKFRLRQNVPSRDEASDPLFSKFEHTPPQSGSDKIIDSKYAEKNYDSYPDIDDEIDADPIVEVTVEEETCENLRFLNYFWCRTKCIFRSFCKFINLG